MGHHVIKHWSSTQAGVALSSGEAELAATVRGGTESLGMLAVMADFGFVAGIAMESDATASIGMVRRLGLGRVRHLAVGDLWIQQRVRRGDLSVSKLPGVANPSDILTKGVDQSSLEKHLRAMGCVVESGRTTLAPQRS